MDWVTFRAIVGPLAFVGTGFLLYFCWRFLNDGRRGLADAERKLGEAARKAADAEHNLSAAELLATTAASTMEVLARIERNIISPRIAFHRKDGTFRGLLAGEALHGDEVEAAPPDPNCRHCYGRGWTVIDRATKARELCLCVRRAIRA